MNKKKVLFVLGPTGVGKSSLAVNLAKKYDMEIISADSVQVYREFNIGSAKVTNKEMQGVVHYGIDILSPNQTFSASEFVDYTKLKIEEITSKGKIPLIVGGTGLYVKALVEGYNFGGTERHEEFRNQLEQLAELEGLESLYNKLVSLAPQIAEKIDKQNKVRLIRAIEIATFGSQKTKNEVDYDFLCIALNMPREKLYENINKRAKIMLDDGLVGEVKTLYLKYGDCQPMGAIGYKETLSFIKNEIDEKQLLELISQHTRNYAKRQLTFLRGLDYIKYFDKTENNYQEKIEKEIDSWIQKLN